MTLSYEIVTRTGSGKVRKRGHTTDSPLSPGAIIVLGGRNWLVERVDESSKHVFARAARYRVRLTHPDGHEQLGAFRRFRADAPRIGHAFGTIEGGQPVSWEVTDDRLAYDEAGEPYLELVAERSYGELEELPDHELEHALATQDEELQAEAAAALARAEQAGLEVELVALEAGEAPDWASAKSYIDALILEEIEDDLLELCGVDPDHDPRDTWLTKVKGRLGTDLELFRVDVEGDHDEIEEWDFRAGCIFASVGSLEDEADPARGHGWMCRLVDVGALGAAGFERVRRAQLAVG